MRYVQINKMNEWSLTTNHWQLIKIRLSDRMIDWLGVSQSQVYYTFGYECMVEWLYAHIALNLILNLNFTNLLESRCLRYIRLVSGSWFLTFDLRPLTSTLASVKISPSSRQNLITKSGIGRNDQMLHCHSLLLSTNSHWSQFSNLMVICSHLVVIESQLVEWWRNGMLESWRRDSWCYALCDMLSALFPFYPPVLLTILSDLL